MQAIFTSMTFQVAGCGPVTLSQAGKQVQVRGSLLRATADRLTRGGADGANLVLEGNVRLNYRRNGKRAEVCADRVAVNLVSGHVEVDLGATAPNPEPPPPPVTPASGALPAPVPTTRAYSPGKGSMIGLDGFSFSPGLFR